MVQLQPAELWRYFLDICRIPRPSKKEEKIAKYIMDFAEKHSLEARQDHAGNIVIRKPARPGYEKRKSVVLQSHLDMVAEKHSDHPHDFAADPIVPYIDGAWIKARGTTLGADNGIGMASQLAILASNHQNHGPLECLFTVDEESGLTGAFQLQNGFFNAGILLNLDSENEGDLFIGCAGGMDTVATFSYHPEKVPAGAVAFKITVKGLKGGHSGDDIDKGRGNAVKIITRFLRESAPKHGLRLSFLDGGNLRNAIPREAHAVFALQPGHEAPLREDFEALRKEIIHSLQDAEPDITIQWESDNPPESVMDTFTQENLLHALQNCPHGVISMSRQLTGLVETSTNLASVKFLRDNLILVATSQRSAVEASKHEIAQTVENVFRRAGADVRHTQGYPGWTPNIHSEILAITRAAYQQLFGVDPGVRAIHAGLECGLFLEKYPSLDMISFGPTILDAHSPSERLHIASTHKYWDLLCEVLTRIPEEKY